MFAAVVSAGGKPVDLQTLRGAGCIVESPGGSGRVALVCSAPGGDCEASGIQSLSGRYWIVGRIRLDARDELRSRLSQRTGTDHRGHGDALLCLHAYAAWGGDFTAHLAGDFCFALWDDAEARLVCARDRLGVRPLFHSETGETSLVADSLAWIRARLPAHRELDDLWIADFLGPGYCLDPERTVWRDIHRLAPAHVLAVSAAGASVHRYWRLQVDEPLRLRDGRDYVARFVELLDRSVADRLPEGRVGISLSGGLDSTTLAASALRVAGDPSRLIAECLHFEKLMPDDESHYASLAARHLGIELVLRAGDDTCYDTDWRLQAVQPAEPCLATVSARSDSTIARDRAQAASVWFHGEGPDNALTYERDAYLAWLLERGDWWRLAQAALQSALAKGTDAWGQTLQRVVRSRPAPTARHPVPPWLERALVDRLQLENRWRDRGKPAHSWHPRAVASFEEAIWPALLEEFDFDVRQAPIVWRHPFLDLRVLEFMLSVPPVPWARRKLLLRQAMRGALPAAVLARRKTPLAASPLAQAVRAQGLPGLSRDKRLDRYVDPRALPVLSSSDGDVERLVAVQALDHWLASLAP